jgi:hypothetical protein
MRYLEVEHLSDATLKELHSAISKAMDELYTENDGCTSFSAMYQEFRKLQRATTNEKAKRWNESHKGHFLKL